jgi:4-amino-4-deoxy-L-arabinose transferase-like glycosyltransferase
VYNGFGRFGEETPLQLMSNELQPSMLALSGSTNGPAADRLLTGDLGRDAGWLLPAAAFIAILGIAGLRRSPRRDPLRASFILWGGWLLVLWVTFSVATTINTYYTAALAPAIGAIVGAGVALACTGANRTAAGRRTDPGGVTAAGRRIVLAVVVAGTAAYAAWLVPSSGNHVPGWLVPAVIAVGVLAAGTALASLTMRQDAVFAAALGAGVLAVSLAPAVASAGLTANHESAFDVPFEPLSEAASFDMMPMIEGQASSMVPQLQTLRHGAPYLMATQSSALASVFSSGSEEVLPIGGFTGTIPSPTLGQLKADVRAGKFHFVLAYPSTDPRIEWIAHHCEGLGPLVMALQRYYCVPADG